MDFKGSGQPALQYEEETSITFVHIIVLAKNYLEISVLLFCIVLQHMWHQNYPYSSMKVQRHSRNT